MNGIKKEINIENFPIPVSIERTSTILKQMKYSICKIITKEGHGTGFFCKINPKLFNKNKNIFNYKVFLITNYHIINKDNIINNQIIFTLYDDQIYRVLNFDVNRKTYFNKDFDIAIIEIKNTDEIKYFLELDDGIFKEKSQEFYKRKSIYNISYPKNESVSVSYGILNHLNENKMIHKCSTDNGSSGSPILNLKNNKVIGIHVGSYENSSKLSNTSNPNNPENSNNPYDSFNIGIFLKKPIIDFIQKNIDYFNNNIGSIVSIKSPYSSEISSSRSSNIYNSIKGSASQPNLFYNNQKCLNTNTIEIKLLALEKDLKQKIYFLNETKEIKYEQNIEVYINNVKTEKFKKYFRPQQIEAYTIKLSFKQNITDCNGMFQDCKNITSIDLSNFQTENVTDMSYMFNNCTNLITINLSSFKTQNVIKMTNMFCFCTKLNTINGLSSFNTSNVTDMHEMFFGCESLTSLDLSSFDFTNAIDIKYMLYKCKCLKKLVLRKYFIDRVIRESNSYIGEIKIV